MSRETAHAAVPKEQAWRAALLLPTRACDAAREVASRLGQRYVWTRTRFELRGSRGQEQPSTVSQPRRRRDSCAHRHPGALCSRREAKQCKQAGTRWSDDENSVNRSCASTGGCSPGSTAAALTLSPPHARSQKNTAASPPSGARCTLSWRFPGIHPLSDAASARTRRPWPSAPRPFVVATPRRSIASASPVRMASVH